MTPEVLRLSRCSAQGRHGPTQAMCDSDYIPGLVQVAKGYQIYRITRTGRYEFRLAGASGGLHTFDGLGGWGAVVEGQVDLKSSDKIVVVVGQSGWSNYGGGNWGGGGGGATFFAKMVLPGQGDKMGKLGLYARLIAVAGGGSGMDSRKLLGQAPGGRAIQDGNATQGAAGELSGGGGGYDFLGKGGGANAQSFITGATGGGTDTHYGGFGGGGGPFNGGGGGGGFIGGDCILGGKDNECFGGSSIGGINITPSANADHGSFMLRLLKRPDEQGGESALFEYTQDNSPFPSLDFVDFDQGCGAANSAACQGEVDLTSAYRDMGVSFPGATNIASDNAASPGFCAKVGPTDALGNAPLRIEFVEPVARVGFYYYSKQKELLITVTDANGAWVDLTAAAQAATGRLPFFGIEGKDISSVVVTGSDYCIDDLRWLAKKKRMQAGLVDFMSLRDANSTNRSSFEFEAPNGIELDVSTWGTFQVWANGLVAKLKDQPLGDKGKAAFEINSDNLPPSTPYRIAIWTFHGNASTIPTRWAATANGKAFLSGETRYCRSPGQEGQFATLPMGSWLPHCGASATGVAYSDDEGQLQLSIKFRPGNHADADDEVLTLSGIAMYDAQDVITVTTTSTARVGFHLDEEKCGSFTVSGWTARESMFTHAGRIHGVFIPIQNPNRKVTEVNVAKTFTQLPPHDAFVMSLRLWATPYLERPLHDLTKKLSITSSKDVAWEETLPEESDCSASRVGYSLWKQFDGQMPDKAYCYVDVGFAIESFHDVVPFAMKSAYFAFSKLIMFAGLTTFTTLDSTDQGWETFKGVGSQPENTSAYMPFRIALIRSTEPEDQETKFMMKSVHGPYRPGEIAMVRKKFTGLGRHTFARVSLVMFFAYDGPRKAETVRVLMKADGVSIFAKTLSKLCMEWSFKNGVLRAPPAFLMQKHPRLTWVDGRKGCVHSFSSGLPHSKSSLTLEIIVDGTKGYTWGFSNMSLSIGSESVRCEPSVCRTGWALKDGPPWCVGKCSVSTCCYMLGTCTASSCPVSEGLMPKAYGVPTFCRGATCTTDECCQAKGRCSADLCEFGYKVKDYLPETCESEICTTDECCDRQGTCSRSICRRGFAALEGDIRCPGTKCSLFDCCRQLGRCTGDVCQGAGFMPKDAPPEHCVGETCGVGECCTQRATCSIDLCPRGWAAKTARYMPRFCRGEKCHFEECCRPRGVCQASLCGANWTLKENRPEFCATDHCHRLECCTMLGLCMDRPCPYGFQAKAQQPAHCIGDTCEPAECCEPSEEVKTVGWNGKEPPASAHALVLPLLSQTDTQDEVTDAVAVDDDKGGSSKDSSLWALCFAMAWFSCGSGVGAREVTR
eukprot:TRINITY_DN12350_c0_g5_i1.p1 TRINITY_DN12350_c0_g5~~TRINITY_DN12350_c0_g5_i1.p1  ORF type:complete len:1352 (-),score=240.05 TRINITY_DN12350_c0_g5_i1:28-4083(-)